MNQKALHTLEYDKIIRLLIDKATSDPGRKMCENLQPGNSISQIDLRQEQTAAALDRLFKKGSISFGNNHDFSYACKHLAIGGSLSCTELLQIAGQLENVTRIKSYGRMEKEYTDCLSAFFDELEPLTNIQTEIRRCIIAEDEYADDASSTLRQIRRQLASTGEKIHSQLLSMVNGSYRTYLQDAVITMRNNRYCLHPLLKQDSVVPIDIHLGDSFKQLIITGPNTGGKTVSLKTAGLLCLMAQAGLHIPALDRSEICVFREIFADIGDEQSIEQSLSTFSSHMTNIVHIMKEADNHSLCLFDELCAGTDPTEGAALAIAILSTLQARGCFTMATTHYSEIKIYALSTDGVENACCEFDVEKLAPTYHLLIGVPGKSNAFAISEKLGLSDKIIEKARQQISSEQESFEDVLSSLETRRVQLERERADFNEQKQKLENRLADLTRREEKLQSQKDDILRNANEQARDILRDAKKVADETIRSFQKFDDNSSMKEMEQKRTKVREKISEKDSKLTLKAPKVPKGSKVKATELHLGDRVKVLSMNLRGTVSSKPDAKGYLFVQCGIIRSKVHISDLVLIPEDDITASTISHSSYGKITMAKSANVRTEINLLGKTVDEALNALDKYLDDAYMAHIPSVRIVHGKGTGALRNAVQTHLRALPYVASFRLGEYGEGDAGVTIATFK